MNPTFLDAVRSHQSLNKLNISRNLLGKFISIHKNALFANYINKKISVSGNGGVKRLEITETEPITIDSHIVVKNN